MYRYTYNVPAESTTKVCFFIFNCQRLIRLRIANYGKIYGQYRGTVHSRSRLRVDAALYPTSAIRPSSSQTRRKRAASRGAAKAGQGAAITPPPTIAAHAGNSDVPATATCRRHLLCGNPSTWSKQSYGVCSNIKVDNVHNPT